MSTPNDIPANADALRLARINLRSRLLSLAGRTKSMNIDAIELFHYHLDYAREEIRNAERRLSTVDTMAMPWPWRCIRCHRSSDALDEHKVCALCVDKEKP
ncbi:hypothetical protein [Mycolicibacterium sp. HS_4_1]